MIDKVKCKIAFLFACAILLMLMFSLREREQNSGLRSHKEEIENFCE